MLLLKFIEFSQAFVVPSAPSLYDKSLTIPSPPPQKKEAELDYLKQRHSRIPLGMFFRRMPKYQKQ